ncbi:MAG: 30S ribosomal protein S9 [Candidatus Jacksonbacteria bacterium]|jgi:small subunit ribosomal protein S9|nr:30S ribosomal protein S9 [Candidatus Jacksonbacteria bacterium]MBT6034322.1 30S ribosomal protein S9 [Candidatus Jacksonbacteria bacterium]MBT6301443.1 30S ribosomal protein S9 [Candidatus Jacksonbacteria bacterium]MBT6757025.1 30S ribosomal protein S9 [Candidatus Jacksonbacteria bacterium]MBT6955514.1 30S ribosomal protein S9 [Candidatus Jacksonbacteria bacterium]
MTETKKTTPKKEAAKKKVVKKATKEPTTAKKKAADVVAASDSDGSKADQIFADRKYIYAVGRRKNSSARVRLYTEGKGRIYVNGREFRAYFPFSSHQKNVTQPLDVLKIKNDFDVSIVVKGGGIVGQSEAARHGLARALVMHNEVWKQGLKKMGLLTRDARKKERKKPGLKKARRAPQWSKR